MTRIDVHPDVVAAFCRGFSTGGPGQVPAQVAATPLQVVYVLAPGVWQAVDSAGDIVAAGQVPPRAVTLEEILSAWGDSVAAAAAAFRAIVVPQVEEFFTWMNEVSKRHPTLLGEPVVRDPFERAMQAKRRRSTGPPAPRLDGRRR